MCVSEHVLVYTAVSERMFVCVCHLTVTWSPRCAAQSVIMSEVSSDADKQTPKHVAH